MSAGWSTSRVFEVSRLVRARLESQSWPSWPGLGSPEVAFAEPDLEKFAEHVVIVPQVDPDASITWGPMPGDRDERFTLQIVIVSRLDVDDAGMLERLEVLADVVQRAFWDDTTGVMWEPPVTDGEFTGLEGVDQVIYSIVPVGRPAGMEGRAVVSYRLHLRI